MMCRKQEVNCSKYSPRRKAIYQEANIAAEKLLDGGKVAHLHPHEDTSHLTKQGDKTSFETLRCRLPRQKDYFPSFSLVSPAQTSRTQPNMSITQTASLLKPELRDWWVP